PEEILLDLNALAVGHPFLALGAYAVNDDADRLAYTLDYTGFREYTLFVKHLTTGELEPDRIEKVSTVAWSARPGTLLYVSEDAAKRPYRLWRHRLGDASDDLIFEEADELFRVHVWRSRSRAWLFAAARDDGRTRLRVTEIASGVSHFVEFPEPTYEVDAEPNAEFVTPRYRFRYQSLITPASVFDYDMTARTLTLLKQTEVLGGYEPARYRSERIHATAADGTRVPISLIAPTATPRDGSSPLLLAGYGAYGFPYPVMFSSSRLSLLERGVTFAIAHVRGGGDLGKRWHDAGRMLEKRNTFTDFIAC